MVSQCGVESRLGWISKERGGLAMTDTNILSKRELEVAELLLQGKSNKQIALALDISDHTVEFHLKNIYAKLHVSSRTEAILILGKSTGAFERKPGESAVESTSEKIDNRVDLVHQSSTIPVKDEATGLKKIGGTLGNYKLFILIGILLTALLVSAPQSSRQCKRRWRVHLSPRQNRNSSVLADCTITGDMGQ
jgi:DNA-binding CsgD family transcriptional regulator